LKLKKKKKIMSASIRNFNSIRRALLKARSVAISGHINPDGDSIGSILALGLALESLGKKVYMLCQDDVPPGYKYLPGATRLLKTTKSRVDLAIAVDCSVIELLDKNIQVFKKAKSILEIDHHAYRKAFGDLRIIDHEAAAVGELIYLLLAKCGITITRDISENLLTSIIVETNLFKLTNVRWYTFKVCAELLSTGLNFYQLVEKVYGPKTRQTMMLLGMVLLRAKFLKNGAIVWSIIRKDDLKKVGGKEYDADAIANELRSIKGVRIAVLFREKNDRMLRVSLRSAAYDIDVGKIAWNHEGGGHFDIAGCFIANNKRHMRNILSEVEGLVA